MLDPKRILDAEAKGVAFICRMCINWHLGEDLGLVDVDGDQICASVNGCGSPISGKSFEEYQGPLTGYLANYCYICGKHHPEKALEPNAPGARKIGCCDDCFENKVKQLVVRKQDREVIFTPVEKVIQ